MMVEDSAFLRQDIIVTEQGHRDERVDSSCCHHHIPGGGRLANRPRSQRMDQKVTPREWDGL